MATPIQEFFNVILAGESKTYNDHNWYTNSGLKGYIEGRYGSPYPLLQKDLSKYTIGEVMNFQSRGRDATGQLFATGRYQIIPVTFSGLVRSLNLPSNKVYDADTQDLMAYQLLMERTNLRKYLQKEVDDTQENLEKAALDVSKIWSSVGVPYATQGNNRAISKNESYYADGDRATVKTEDVQVALRNLRKGGAGSGFLKGLFSASLDDKQKNVLLSVGGIAFLGASVFIIYQIKKRFF